MIPNLEYDCWLEITKENTISTIKISTYSSKDMTAFLNIIKSPNIKILSPKFVESTINTEHTLNKGNTNND